MAKKFEKIEIESGEFDDNGIEISVSGEDFPRVRLGNDGIAFGDGTEEPTAFDPDASGGGGGGGGPFAPGSTFSRSDFTTDRDESSGDSKGEGDLRPWNPARFTSLMNLWRRGNVVK